MDERSKRTLKIIIGLVVAVLLGTVYSSYLMPQKTHLVFGATYMTMNNPFYEVINNELKKDIEKEGDELIVRNPELNIEKQNQQIEEFVAMKVDGIFVNPIASDKLSRVQENRDYCHAILIHTTLDERGVTLMKRSHSWYKTDFLTLLANCEEFILEVNNLIEYFHC